MRSNRTGMAVVELMIGIAIAIVSFGAIFALAAQSMRAARDMRGDAIAEQVAESEIERLRAFPWEAVLRMGTGFDLDPQLVPALAELSGGKGTVRIVSLAVESSEAPRGVSVRITWTGCNGRSREIALSTIMSRRAAEDANVAAP